MHWRSIPSFSKGPVTGILAVGRQTHQYPNDDLTPAMNFSLRFSGALKLRPSDKRATQNGTTSRSGDRPSTYELLRLIIHVYDVLACVASLADSIISENVEKMR